METPETTSSTGPAFGRSAGRRTLLPDSAEGVGALGERLTWVSALVLAVAVFGGWYQGSGEEGPVLSVTGWHTPLGKLVLLIAVLVLVLVVLRELGIDLPAAVPESLVVIGLGSLATIFVLIRLFDVPEEYLPADGRAFGIWIALAGAVGIVVSGLMQAAEEL